MGTTADKLTYLNNTKIAIKNELNKLGAEIEDNDTFRSYVNALESIYNDYPTINDTASNILLNNTKKAPFKKLELNSTELTQDGTPSPSSPVDVNVIKGSNNIKISNSDSSEEQNYPISLSSKNLLNVPSTFTFKATYSINMELEAGNYTLSWSSVFTDSTNTRANIIMRYEDGTTSGNNFVDFTSTSKSLTPTKKVNRIYFYSDVGAASSANVTITYENLMLEQGSTATEYEPYHEPIEYCKIRDYAYQISNQFESKNSFNIDDFVTKMSIPFNATNQDGVVTITRKSATTYDYPLNCKENTQYTLSMDFLNTASGNYYIRFKYSDNTYSDIVTLEGYSDFTKITATSTVNKTLISINFQLYGYNNNIKIKNIQLEEGSTATEYMPYGIIKGEWYLKKNIGKIVLNGSEDWNYVSGTHSRFTMPKSDIVLQEFNANAPNIAISDYFKASNWYSVYSFAAVDDVICSHNSAHVINIKSTQFTSLDDFKTWLSTHNTKVYYAQTTPTYIHISESDYPILKAQLDNLYNNANSYNGQTNITQTNDNLPFNINASALMKGDI